MRHARIPGNSFGHRSRLARWSGGCLLLALAVALCPGARLAAATMVPDDMTIPNFAAAPTIVSVGSEELVESSHLVAGARPWRRRCRRRSRRRHHRHL